MSVVLQFFKELGPIRLALAGLAAFIFILFFSIFVYKVSSSEMHILYSNLDIQDSNKIVQEIEGRDIPYELAAGGTTIKVPKEQVLKLRVSLAQDNIPNKGSVVGYEIFDKEESLGSTSFLQNVKLLRALEGEIIRTIESFDQIEKARVHLVVPKKELFSKERQEPRASVVLKLKGGKTLQKQEVDSISHLVASSVPELDVANITIVDTKGKSLKLSQKDNESGSYASNQNDERKIALENKYKRIIEDLLEKTLGTGKVNAQVNLEMNFDRVVSNSEYYDPDGSVLRSSQSIEDKERTPAGGGEDSQDASVANNLPGGAGGGEGGSNFATLSRTDETKNYEISKTVTNQIKDSGAVQKLSVAVLVDGTYKKDETGKDIYTPRTTEELSQIENIVKVAVGFSETRKDQLQVVNMPFTQDLADLEQEGMKDWIKDQLPSLIQTIVIATVTIVILIMVIRPIAIKAFDINKNDFQIDPMLKDQLDLAQATAGVSPDEMVNISKVSGTVVATAPENVIKINSSAETQTQETLMIIKRWLNEEG